MIVVVSGLPRSGTSLMMQMLRAGGMPLLTDDLRPADVDNPNGYWEYEPVKRLQQDNSWISKAEGKAVKVVSALLQYLHQQHMTVLHVNYHETIADPEETAARVAQFLDLPLAVDAMARVVDSRLHRQR